MRTVYEHDALGRQVKEIRNPTQTNGSSSSSSGSSAACPESMDENVTVVTACNADGNVASITAINPMTGDQTTEYVYGTTLADSAIASTLLKRKEIYPDSTGGDDNSACATTGRAR